jgi:hypothetical protein
MGPVGLVIKKLSMQAPVVAVTCVTKLLKSSLNKKNKTDIKLRYFYGSNLSLKPIFATAPTASKFNALSQKIKMT